MNNFHWSKGRIFLAAAIVSFFVGGCGGSGGTASPPTTPPPPPPPPPPPVTADWDVDISRTSVAGPLSPALVGYYDLSGSLFSYQNVPGLVDRMYQAGFSPTGAGADWRIGLGRWELATEIFSTLTGGSPCMNATPQNQSVHATDIDLLAARDWFTYTDGSPVTSVDINDTRYSLNYVRSAIDVADIFGATSFVSIDLMPRALSINQTPNRLDCDASFTNSVSNNEPADPGIFAEAATGLVQRVVEGTGLKTGADRPRPVSYWEIWNEPELALFWEPTLTADPNSYFDMAIATLSALDSYRNTTIDANGQAIRIGLGSFLNAGTAVATVQNLDPASVPFDFISFHVYDDDPLVIVDNIVQTAAALANSTNYQDAEIVLAEWGSDLSTRTGDQQYAATMLPALHAATVVALGATAGLDRAHNTFFYDFYPVLAIGLVDNGGNPRRLYRGYELLAKMVEGSAQRLAITGVADGRYDAGMGAALVAEDTLSGTVRVLLVNRNSTLRRAEITLDGVVAAPTQLYVFDSSDDPANDVTPVAGADSIVELPAESIVIAEF